MNISSVSYNGTMQNTEQKTIQPLQNVGGKVKILFHWQINTKQDLLRWYIPKTGTI